jgi:hypothetical protein
MNTESSSTGTRHTLCGLTILLNLVSFFLCFFVSLFVCFFLSFFFVGWDDALQKDVELVYAVYRHFH